MSLAKTKLQDIRVKYPSNLDKFENRQTRNGLLETVIQQMESNNSIISPDLKEQARKSVGRNLDIPVMKKGVVSISNVRSCTINGGRSESDLVRVLWKTIASDILMIPAEYETNQINYEFDFQKKIREMVEAWKIEMEEDIETALDANKSLVYNSTIVGGKYDFVGGAIQVTPTQQEWFFNDLEAINMADDFYEPEIRVVANHTVMPMVKRYINQGDGNNTNTAYQFENFKWTFSNRIENEGDATATGYFMPDGSIGLLTRTDQDAQRGSKATDGTEWFEERLPGFPFTVGVLYKSRCSDQSALDGAGFGHLTATLVEQFQFSIDYAILVPYNTNLATKASPIRKFEFVPAA